MLDRTKIELHMTMEELHGMLERYHYAEKDLEMITHLYHAIEPVIDAWCYYEINPTYDFVTYEQYIMVLVTLGKGIDGIIEAYEEASCIEEAYMIDCIGSELLWLSYGKIQRIVQETHGLWQTKLEFLGDEYPMACISEVIAQMRNEWNDICETPEGIEGNPFEKRIQCNKACLLTPKKSVVYIAKVQRSKPDGEQGVCVNLCDSCGNRSCQNRSVFMEEKRDSSVDDEKADQVANEENRSNENRSNENRGNENRNNGNRKWTYGYQTIFRKKDVTDDSKDK